VLKGDFQKKVKSRLSHRYQNEHVKELILFAHTEETMWRLQAAQGKTRTEQIYI
jgi:hypothetical protein